AVELANNKQAPGPESSVIKIFASELLQTLNDLLIEAAGAHAPTESPIATDFGAVDVAAPFLQSRRVTIYGGSSEIQRNVLARRVLNLPSGRCAIMDLHLTSEQTLLRDSAAKFVVAAGPKVARGLRDQDPSFAPARLREAGELGWLGILVPPAANGLGLGLTALAFVLGQAGRGLVCEPVGLSGLSAPRVGPGAAPPPRLGRAI